jgi:WD40 repeat protein
MSNVIDQREVRIQDRCGQLILLPSCLMFLLGTVVVAAPQPGKEALANAPNHVDQLGDPLPAEAILRLGTSRLHHEVASLAWSPDGKAFLTGSNSDNYARLWDSKTGKELQCFRGPSQGVYSVLFVSGGKHVITFHGQSILCWDARTGKEVWRFEEEEDKDKMYGLLMLTPDGKTVMSVGPELFCWDVATGKRTQKLSILPRNRLYWHGEALSRDGKRIALCDEEHIQLWDLDTEKQVAQFKIPKKAAGWLKFMPDGKSLLSVSKDRCVQWNVETGKEIRSCPITFAGFTRDIYHPLIA